MDIKDRNLIVMEHNVAIVMRSYIHFDDDGNETEIVAPDDAGGFLFLKVAMVPMVEPLDLEAEMLKLGFMWVGVPEGKKH